MESGFKVGMGRRKVVGGIKYLAMVAEFDCWIVASEFGKESLDNGERIDVMFTVACTDVKTDGKLVVWSFVGSNNRRHIFICCRCRIGARIGGRGGPISFERHSYPLW